MTELTVSKTREGCYRTIGAALADLPKDLTEHVAITVEPGIYEELVEIRRSNLTLLGTGAPEQTVVQFGNYANMKMEDGSKRGTFRSYAMLLDGDHLTLENLTVRNTAWPRREVAQALALYADGDMLLVRNCRLESYQDTLFTGPLPPTPNIPGSFVGPKEHDERRVGRQKYENCLIAGDVDFIFGSAMALFYKCELRSRNGQTEADQAPESGILGYVTAASTPEGYPVGYVFEECRFTSEDCPEGSVYLGRPWRNFAKTVMIRCELGAHIHPSGFHDWNKPDAHETMRYGEYENFGPGADRSQRADFVRCLTQGEVQECLGYFAEFANET